MRAIVRARPHRAPNGVALHYLCMRLFVGIPLADAVIAGIEALIRGLRAEPNTLRWIPPESWHITLEFLGSTTPLQHDLLLAHLAQIRHSPVVIGLDEPGIFDRASVFHIGVQLTPPLIGLQHMVAASVARCGFSPETRPYNPHITLARAKGEGRARQLRAFEMRLERAPELPSFTATEFLLYESRLSQAGAKYEVRARFPLRFPLIDQPAAPGDCAPRICS